VQNKDTLGTQRFDTCSRRFHVRRLNALGRNALIRMARFSGPRLILTTPEESYGRAELVWVRADALHGR
jgi:hypothetical protein